MRESIKIPNSVIVRRATGTFTEDELVTYPEKQEVGTYLEKYGEINRLLPIDDTNSEFHQHILAEFKSGTATQTLEPLLPLKFKSSIRDDIEYEIQSLASVYTLNARVNATKTYMEEHL